MSADPEILLRGVVELADEFAPYDVLTVSYDEDFPRGMCWCVGPERGPFYRGKSLATACKNWQRAYRAAARG